VGGIAIEDKPDDSPVTAADRACERLFVEALRAAFPADGLLGEEGASFDGTSGRRWIIDPIDGTRDYVRGNRLFCNLLALEVAGVVELGVATFPALDEVYWAVRGAGAWRTFARRTEALHASAQTAIERSVIGVGGLERAIEFPFAAQLLEFLGRFWTVRSLGGAWDAMSVCAGQADFWLEPCAKPWDLAVVQILAREAGLRFFDYSGADTIYGGSAVLCVPGLEAAARAFLGLPAVEVLPHPAS
jgi:fructose-1,6-bisphosphatase/inositol monophosphatase family enzyme